VENCAAGAESFVFADAAATPFLNQLGVAQIWKGFQQGELQWEFVISILLSFTISAPVWGNTEAAAPIPQSSVLP
jgi:hypothetical protein